MILLEEVNATMAQLKRYWAKTRESGDPKTSPAVEALAEILFMGRQVRLHVLLVAQSATANAGGGPTTRESFATSAAASMTKALVLATTLLRLKWLVVPAAAAQDTNTPSTVTETAVVHEITRTRPPLPRTNVSSHNKVTP
ncbi:hypothetical protein [Streptomyces sp. NPDC020141]|uniref:hypothetical protein n=1 Tax=Streptomyces sp. NPDC020141 TaxID=3365065 RepID=UPI003798BC03